jgi:2-enoate reductase
VAEFLACRGKKVTIVEILPEPAAAMEGHNRRLLLERLDRLSVKILTGSELLSFQGTRAVIRKGGESLQVDADGVVSAIGSRSNRDCAELESCGRPFYTVGDAVETRDIAAAVHEGFRAAMEV